MQLCGIRRTFLLMCPVSRVTTECCLSYSSPQQTNTQNNTPENTILVSEVLRLVQEHYADPLFSMKNVS